MNDFIKALEDMSEAMNRLNEAWEANDEINDMQALEAYPFDKDFEELKLDVMDFKEAVKEEQEGK